MKSSLPTFELLDKTHAFPGPYVFKIIGKPDQGFLVRVIAAVREELLVEADPPYRVREAVGGRHVSVTRLPRRALSARERITRAGGQRGMVGRRARAAASDESAHNQVTDNRIG